METKTSVKKKHEAMRPRRRWDNIRMNLKERVCVDVDWIQMAENGIQKRGFFNRVINFRDP
jgi:hypothetical protein